MKTRNSVRNLLMIALLIGGIFAVGTQTQTLAQDRSGFITGGGRSDTTTSTTNSTSSGYLGSGGRAEDGGYMGSGGGRTESTSATQQVAEAEPDTFLETILEFFF